MAGYYQRIQDDVRRRIDTGDWLIGTRLPTETELCRLYDVSRNTVRRALSGLVKDGRLKRVKGTGTFVTRPQIIDRTTLFLQSFREELRAQGMTPVSELLEARFIPAESPDILRALDVPAGEMIFKLRRLSYSQEWQEKGVMKLTTDYFVREVGEAVQRFDLEKESLTHALTVTGFLPRRLEKRFSAMKIPVRECRLLAARPDDLALVVTTLAYNGQGRVFEYSKTLYPLDRYEFKIWIENGT